MTETLTEARPLYRLETPRLRLLACPLKVAKAARGGKRQMETVLRVRVLSEWIKNEARGLLTYYGQWLENDASQYGWGLWLIEQRADRVIIGSVGFKGKPDTNGVVEMGYGIGSAYRRQRYMTEAASALKDWAFTQSGVRVLTAECLVDNIGSRRVIESMGMTYVERKDGYLKYRLDAPNR